jgi:hypothetical protein
MLLERDKPLPELDREVTAYEVRERSMSFSTLAKMVTAAADKIFDSDYITRGLVL